MALLQCSNSRNSMSSGWRMTPAYLSYLGPRAMMALLRGALKMALIMGVPPFSSSSNNSRRNSKRGAAATPF